MDDDAELAVITIRFHPISGDLNVQSNIMQNLVMFYGMLELTRDVAFQKAQEARTTKIAVPNLTLPPGFDPRGSH